MRIQTLILWFKGVMKTLFSIVVDSLERVRLCIMCIINDTSGSFLRWLTGIKTVNSQLFWGMFEEKQIKILFYPHVCAVHCKWFVLYMGKAGLQSNF